MIALRFKLKILCFPQKLSRGRQWVRQSTLHCTTEVDEISQWSIINKEDIHDIKMYVCISIIFLMFFFMTTNKKRQCYPLYFIWQRQQCDPLFFFHDDQLKTTVLPLMFFSWRPIKNNSVTPYVFFMTTKEKQQCYPLCFFSRQPIKNDSFTPCGFFHDDQRKTTVLPLMFFLIKTTVFTHHVSFD